MPRYQYVSFSHKIMEAGVGHDFSFLDSDQFPNDVRIVRVDYNPSPTCGVRLIIESQSYPDLPLDEVLNQDGITLTQYCWVDKLENGTAVQFMSYNPITQLTPVPSESIVFATLNSIRKKKVTVQ
jgi:hypothetical protein